MPTPTDLQQEVQRLPEAPGIYKYFDKTNVLIYVGKAKNIKKRVSSYFSQNGQDRKTRRLVSQINRVEFSVVDTEYDALLLENNLIKEYQPKYNILLKDDKSYPYICVTSERFPRIFPTRRVIKSQGTYYGPYASIRTMNTLLDLFKKLFTFRTCRFALNEPQIQAGKFKVCLEYHIGNCKGPCENKQSEQDYLYQIQQAVNLLKGKLAPARQYFKEQMELKAANFEFEKAQYYKEKIILLEDYQSKSVVVNPSLPDLDIFAILSDEDCAYISYLMVCSGVIVQTHTFDVKKKLDEPDAQILGYVAYQIRQKFGSNASEILANTGIDLSIPGLTIGLPQIGDKRKLVELAIKNVLYFRKDKLNQALKEQTENVGPRVLVTLQQDLRLKELPDHIECFDNSNIQGSNPVASMVCFKNGKPAKKEYRHYHIKTVEGPDDFASMKEIVGRRYKRMLDEAQPLPKLIVIDGGKGQLSSACEALEALGIYGQIPIIGIAKRLEEIYYPNDSYPLHLPKKSESLRLLQQIRDEAHRFAITFHKNVRSKNAIHSFLEELSGFGPKTLETLYKSFQTVKNMENTPDAELEKVIGAKKTLLLRQAFEAAKNQEL